MKESEAWREIARRIAEGQWRGSGMCWEVSRLGREGRVSLETRLVMAGRCCEHVHLYAERCLYAFPSGEQDVRVLAALFLALEAEEEGK